MLISLSRRNCVSLVVTVVVALASAGVVVSGVLAAPAGPEVARECSSCRGSGTQNFVCNFARARGKIKAELKNAFIAKEKGSHPAALAKAPGKKVNQYTRATRHKNQAVA